MRIQAQSHYDNVRPTLNCPELSPVQPPPAPPLAPETKANSTRSIKPPSSGVPPAAWTRPGVRGAFGWEAEACKAVSQSTTKKHRNKKKKSRKNEEGVPNQAAGSEIPLSQLPQISTHPRPGDINLARLATAKILKPLGRLGLHAEGYTLVYTRDS